MTRTRIFIRCFAAVLAMIAITAQVAGGQEQSSAKEQELIAVLQNGQPADKAIACKELAIHGSKAAVPELAKLLADEQLVSWARIALEAIPDPAADEALRNALDTAQGRALIGVINSIGVRRDAQAVEPLQNRLQSADGEVASAAAIALGNIGTAQATQALRSVLAQSPESIRSAVAEGCILCAERLMKDGKLDEAAEIYDEVRAAEVPKQRKLEATRGAILSRKSDGIPLLLEQLNSSDKAFLQIALSTAREMPGSDVADALANELQRATPERAALLLYALADRKDEGVPAAVLTAAKSGERQVRIAAIDFLGRAGNVSSMDALLDVAADNDAELAQAALAALGTVGGEKVNAEILARLPEAEGKTLPILIQLVGTRRLNATDTLIKAIGHKQAEVRQAALTSLGTTADAEQLPVLIQQAISPSNPADAEVARKALREAAVRMPDREACAAQLSAAIEKAPAAEKTTLLEILGAMGGPQALDTIAAAVLSNNADLQDTGSRLLGEWMSVEAAPVLFELAQSSTADKYKIRAVRGYIRLARQFAMPDKQRGEMCSKALEIATRPDEQKLVLAVLDRYPSVHTLEVAIQATKVSAIKDDAQAVAMNIVQKLGGEASNARELLEKIGLQPVAVEIVKAIYGADGQQRDVTETVQNLVGDLPLIALPNSNYNQAFGGDPAPGVPKLLKIQYRIDGKPAEASFAENSLIVLPLPQ